MIKKRVTAILAAAALAFMLVPAEMPSAVLAEGTSMAENAGPSDDSSIEPAANGPFTLTFQTDEEITLTLSGQAAGTVVDLSSYISNMEDYDFGGWYADEALTVPVTSVTMTDNVTVYARWISTDTEDDGTVENPDGSVSTISIETNAKTGAVTRSEEIEYPDETCRTVITVTKTDGSTEVSDVSYDRRGKAVELLYTSTKDGAVTKNTSYQLKGDKATLITIIKSGSTSIAIPDKIKDPAGKQYKVTAIAEGACKKNTALKQLVIGKNVQTIGASAFQGCVNLSSIRTGNKLTKIGSKAFRGLKAGAVIKISISQNNYQKIVKMLKASGCKKAEFQKV